MGPKNFFGKRGKEKTPDTLPDKTLENRHLSGLDEKLERGNARRVMESFAAKDAGANPYSIFNLDRDARRKVVSDFCEEALQNKCSRASIYWAMRGYSYPSKLLRYHDTSKNQAAGAILLAGTEEVNWFELLEGGAPIVENGALLNGLFGREIGCCEHRKKDMHNQITDTLYLPKHDQHADLPQSPWIMFGEMSNGEKHLEHLFSTPIGGPEKGFEALRSALDRWGLDLEKGVGKKERAEIQKKFKELLRDDGERQDFMFGDRNGVKYLVDRHKDELHVYQMGEAMWRALAHRSHFKKSLGGTVGNVDDNNHLKISDLQHRRPDTTTKFRLLCTVFDNSTGELLVVSGNRGEDGRRKMPVRFDEWIYEKDHLGQWRNLKNILSASQAKLEEIKEFVERPGGLLEQLHRPGNGLGGYRPWENLKEAVKQKLRAETKSETEPGSEDGYYKEACKIWRYALIMRQAENVKNYRDAWGLTRGIEEINRSVRKIACNDGRHAGDIKVLGAFMTDAEFIDRLKEWEKSEEGDKPFEELLLTPHYKCGFLSALHKDVHVQFHHLAKVLDAEYGDTKEEVYSDYRKNVNFFRGLIRDVRKGGDRPITEVNTLIEHIPPYIVDELDAYLADKAAGRRVPDESKNENRRLAEFLYSAFIYNDETLRAAMRRGLDEGILKIDDKRGFLYMPAAKATYTRLAVHFPDGEYSLKFTPEQINSFVIEEVARAKLEHYRQILQERGRAEDIRLTCYLENFQTGQATEVPKSPKRREDFENIGRRDFFLNNPDFFSEQDVVDLGLWDKRVWNLAV